MSHRTIADRVLLGLAALLAAIGVARLRPPSTVDPIFHQDLARALEILGPDPRPVGSPGHEGARTRLISELHALGAEPQVQRAMSCGRWGRCAEVANVVGRLGPSEGRPIAVVAHYDSVPAGPGAADDGAGVAAVLSIARRYHRDPPPRPVLLVLTDGEELGLLGARALVTDHRLDDVAALVNLEARGTGGPSLLFETAGPTSPAVARFAAVATRPFTSSLFDAVYQVLPNDTDLTELRALGVPAFNLAFIGAPRDYHTPMDGERQLSEASAAHQAANAAALVDSLVRDPPVEGGSDATWFDVLGLAVPRFPLDWVLPLGVLSLGGLAFGARRTGVRARPVAVGVGLVLLGTVAAALLGVGLTVALHWTTVMPWRGSEWPVQLALIGAGAAVGLGLPRFGPRAEPGIWFGAALVGTLVAISVAIALPGAAFLWLVPAAVAGVLSPRPPIAAAAAAIAAVVLWGPVVVLLYGALGSPLAAVVTVAAAAGTGWLGLALRDAVEGRVAAGLAGVAGAIGVAAGLVPWGEPEPQNVVIEYGDTRSYAFSEGAQRPIAPIPEPAPEPPIVGAHVDQDGVARVQVHSARGATTIGLRWEGPPGVEVRVDGVPGSPVERLGRQELWIYGVGPEGVDLELVPAPTGLRVLDEAPSVGPHPTGTYPFQWGDRTRVSRPVRL